MDQSLKLTLDAFFTAFTKRTYSASEVILRADDVPLGVYYISKGSVRQVIVSEDGDMLVTHVFKTGAFFPMMWVINDTPNKYTYEAMIDAELYRAPKEAMVQFLKSHPDVLYDLTRRLLLGIRGLLDRMELLVLDSALKKTVKLLLYFAKNFSQEKDGTVRLQITHREIASWIGTTRETASLQIETLVKKGLISYNGRLLVISDVEALSREIDMKL